MKTLRILHLSDLHRCPPKENEKSGEQAVGVKEDETVSEDFSNMILEKNWENNFIKQIVAWSSCYAQIDVIVCTGDLGDKGNPESIRLGAHLVAAIAGGLGIDKNNVIVCPGNHDLNRDMEICNAFDNFKNYLTEEGIVNFCNGNDVCVISPNGIPIISINSCLGGNQKSAFVKKYSALEDSLTNEERNEFASNVGDLMKQSFKDGHYDIPAITSEQRKNLMTAIDRETNEKKVDTAIVIMHHHIFPCGPTVIRPYSNIIDGGETLKELRGISKNLFILHGHVHSAEYTLNFAPRYNDRFISTLGAGTFNGAPGSNVNILEFFFSDDGFHLITKIYPLQSQSTGGFARGRGDSYSICDRRLTRKELSIPYNDHLESRPISFNDLSTLTNNPHDDDLMKVLLLDPSVMIDRRGSNDYKQWVFSKS